jgi:hypothetical protein
VSRTKFAQFCAKAEQRYGASKNVTDSAVILIFEKPHSGGLLAL